MTGAKPATIDERLIQQKRGEFATVVKRLKEQKQKTAIKPESVTVAYIHSEEVAYSWHYSIVQLLGWDLEHHQRVLKGGWVGVQYTADGLPPARNLAVKKFLEETDSEWLWWIDTDMGFPPDTVDRLMEVADPKERPIVGALCFAYTNTENDNLGGFRRLARPTIYDWISVGEVRGFVSRAQYNPNELTLCAGTGSACVLIHRSVFEKIAEEYGAKWYDRVSVAEEAGKLISEDLAFCMRAGAVGFKAYVHTGIKTTHLKHTWVAEQDFWTNEVTDPATEEVAVIVPVMKRPANAEPFMRSLRASTGLATAYAICDPDDAETIAAWRHHGAKTIVVDGLERPGTFAEKVNVGFRVTEEPWIFICGDDVNFHPGWLDSAESIAGTAESISGERFHVIGTNDLGNPRVTSGEHATHLLIRRSYIHTVGAGWDGPGIVAHEGYRHWFVDDEIVSAAKQRGVWAMTLGSIVEHYHPAWGKAEMDEVYKLGMSHAEHDRKVFEERCKKHLES